MQALAVLFQTFSFLFFLLLQPLAAELPQGFHYEKRIFDENIPIYILEVDPHYATIKAAVANDFYTTVEKVSSIAKRNGAFAAVNGGFFRLREPEPGTSSGILKVDGILLAPPRLNRAAIGWNVKYGIPHIDRVIIDVPWVFYDTIVGGTPVLIKDGQEIDDYTPEKLPVNFVVNRHARTAIGIKPNGNWVFVVSEGMTLKELSMFMLSLNCVSSLNLDGGGSSTLYLSGQIVNNPDTDDDDTPEGTIGQERAVSNAILIFPKEQVDEEHP